MAATFQWFEHNSNSTTDSSARTEVNWKSVNDSTTAYTAAPVTAGTNSYKKYQFGRFSGTWSTISNVLFEHTAGTLPSNVQLAGRKNTSFTTPDTSDPLPNSPASGVADATTGFYDLTTVTAIGSARITGIQLTQDADNTDIRPADAGVTNEGTSMATSVSSGGYAATEYLITQLKVGGAASAGSIGTITLTLRYDES
jgi:hypothetical protein